MAIKIDTDLITIIGFLVGIFGFIFAIYQTINSRKAKKIYESHCKSKCRNIVSLTRSLSNEVITACDSFNNEIDKNDCETQLPLTNNIQILATKINGINILTERLVTFCIEANFEHEDQFGYKVFPEIEKELPCHECFSNAKRKFDKLIV